MYEPSRHMTSFFISGFQHWEGAFILDKLQAGCELSLKPEPTNPHDPEAVAIYFKDTKLGFMPRDENSTVALMSHFGHADAFEIRVLQVNATASPWKQVRVGIFIRDARN